MKRSALASIVILFVLTGIAAAQGAEPRFLSGDGQNRPGRAFWENGRVADALALTPEEISGLEELGSEHRAAVRDLKVKIRAEQGALRDIMEGEDYSAASAQKQFARVEELRNQLAQEQFDYRIRQRDLLGQQRYVKLMEMKHQEVDRRHGHRRAGR